ncbi:MAG: J domain-containing protein [bacterium]|nr:J domain-containing protein [bacterium]
MELREAYEILSLPFGAPLDDVKKAFHDEAQLCHPDRHSTSSEGVRKRAEERFKLINEANQVIAEFNERFGKFERNDGNSGEIIIDKEPHQPASKEALGKFMVGENRHFETQLDSVKYLLLYMAALFFAFRVSGDSWAPVLIVLGGGIVLLLLRILIRRRG